MRFLPLVLAFCLYDSFEGLTYGEMSPIPSDVAFAVQHVVYEAPVASDVYLLWRIQDGTFVPEALRPPETYLDEDKIWRTHMVRKGSTFTTTVRVPLKSKLEYSFMLATPTGCGQADPWRSEVDKNGRPFIKDVDADGMIQIQSAISRTGDDASGQLVAQQMLVHSMRATDVYLVWGINDWQPLPPAMRPKETYVDEKQIMRTHLIRNGETFRTTINVPRGAKLHYSLMLATRNESGLSDRWRDETDDSGLPFSKEAQSDGIIHIESGTTNEEPLADRVQNWLAGDTLNVPLVTEDIFYRTSEAGEVWLIWGIEGWKPIPEHSRPPGTILQNGVMHTLMKEHNDVFSAHVDIPAGVRLNYAFLVSKTSTGVPVHFKEYKKGSSYSKLSPTFSMGTSSAHLPVMKHRCLEWLSGKVTSLPLIAQDIHYRLLKKDDVWLHWGIDGWQAIPEGARPGETILSAGSMFTRMAKVGSNFKATLKVPPGSILNYEFLAPTGPLPAGRGDAEEAGVVVGYRGGRIDVASKVKKAELDRHKAWPSQAMDQLTLMTQKLIYRIAGADEVWLVWGINGWQPIPEEARPSGTVLKRDVMHTRMVKTSETYETTVRVPPKTILNYKFLVIRSGRTAMVNRWQDFNGQGFWKLVRESGTLEEKATVSVVSPEQRKTWLTDDNLDIPLITKKIRYHAPGAAEVWLAWGIDGWQPAPQSVRPPGTVIRDSKMHSPMRSSGDDFFADVSLPPGASLDFFFLISKTNDGQTVDIRQERDKHGQAFSKTALLSDEISVDSTGWISLRASGLPVAEQSVRYRVGGVKEVWLVWGINEWQPVPEAVRPPGTIIINKLMHTSMVYRDALFVTTVRIPIDAIFDYKFLITKTSSNGSVQLWDDFHGRGFRKRVRGNGVLTEKTSISIVSPEERQLWLLGRRLELPLVTQKVRYRAPSATEVWLAWGIDGWHAVPESSRPPGSVVKDNLVHSPMLRRGETFLLDIQMPPGAVFDFFFVNKTREGGPKEIKQDKDHKKHPLKRIVMFDEQIDIHSTWNEPAR